tara:strand:- start:4003 stop:4575 length:573 start_codon:yes stop_codon:yes gene_type:complete
VITYEVEDKQIQRDLQMLVENGGMDRKYAKMAVKNAAQIIDDEARKKYKTAAYQTGSTDTALRGNTIRAVGKKITFARKRFRIWASKKSSIRFQSKKQRPGNFWFRTMVKRVNNGVGNPSTLAHLVEDGFVHSKTGKKSISWKLRRNAFWDKRKQALQVLESGIAYSLEHAGSGDKPGLMKFRRATRPTR